MATLTISNDLLNNLLKLAETRQLSVNELAEDVLARYAEEQTVAEEIAEVFEAVAQVEKRGNKPYTKEELEAMGNEGVYPPDPQGLDELEIEAAGTLISMEDMRLATDNLITEHKNKTKKDVA